MKNFLFFVAFFLVNNFLHAQNFSGQWKGGFIDKSLSANSWGGNECDYVLDLEVNGENVTGYSYTYFSNDGTKYYTICKLVGKANKKSKYIEVTETARTKTNIPITISNSFQTHKLYWRKEGGKEILEGKWTPAPGQRNSNTGFGTTVLSKRMLSEIAPMAKKIKPTTIPSKKVLQQTAILKKKIAPVVSKSNALKNPLKKVNPNLTWVKKKPISTPKSTITKKPSKPVSIAIIKDTSKNISTTIKKSNIKTEIIGFEKRTSTVLQTITVNESILKLELYDNGEVDGDSVSIFYNNKVVLSHQRLTEKPIKFELPVKDDDQNELVMYADNLGTIPPNTALLIVMDGNKRYEVRITSDLTKSGVIKFIHKKKE